ncbi:helix-turn-helix transcriptional regulator [Algoriphagus lutimaris]|uniref:Transcriptional regulator, AraC family n=1 Tax=Algoriphagus halophilus TaxID=226505 RepID=A0A1N6FXY3_9BACT|nr:MULTISPECIES: helix-turn-helix domain-containing protein [Algoriphagus]MBN3520894.1 helix-turn-helix transcriptional regulator [Algoriphagus lutimaris]SIO00134.1 transcriptional regulator, AraC family [Algoriphagus halophilus]
MEYYNKVIESINVRFLRGNNYRVEKPATIVNYEEPDNTLVLLHHGTLKFGEDQELVNEGEVLFLPGGQKTVLTIGGSAKKSEINLDQFTESKKKHLQSLSFREIKNTEDDCISMVSFESKVFDVVNFFNSLDIPPFIIRFNDRLATIIEDLMKEMEQTHVGRERALKSLTEILVIELLRHILKNRLFLEELSTNSTYFKDPRLIDLFNYIKTNLGGDLSNKILAKVANVSEDYVGQYFKMLTGINPQDYIEYQRMEAAVELLRTTKKSIRDIGKEVGYKDTAYFCRRFKMMYGVPAGKMRRRESLINV